MLNMVKLWTFKFQFFISKFYCDFFFLSIRKQIVGTNTRKNIQFRFENRTRILYGTLFHCLNYIYNNHVHVFVERERPATYSSYTVSTRKNVID